MIRLFIALELPLIVKGNIYFQLKKMIPDFNKFKWQSEDKLHLTLKFIGNVQKELVLEIENALNFICEFEKYFCETGDFDFFYRNKKASIFYLKLKADKKLGILSQKIDNELRKFGIAGEDREFREHLTLLRLNGTEDITPLEVIKRHGIPSEKFIAENVVLYESKLKPSGAVYSKLKIYKLK